MTPVVLKKPVDLSVSQLDCISSVSRPIGELISVMRSKVAFRSSANATNVGVWECSPGRWRRQVIEAEFSTILLGRCTFTPDGGEPVVLESGDSIYFHPHTNGEWNIKETVRKVYVIVPTIK